jgi:S1-C subfamily serine protease
MSSASSQNNLWAAISNQTADLAEQAGNFVVAVHAGHRVTASGVHWKSGVIVTAAHLVRRADEVTVLLPNGTTTKGTVAGRDGTTDLAAIRIAESAGLATPQFTSQTKVGEFILSVARSGRGELSASAGIVARVGERWRTWRGGEIDRLIRPDVRLYPGQSGSALVNGGGAVLGINSDLLARESVITIPVETVNRVLAELLERGHVAQPYLGVAMQQVPLPSEWQKVAGTQQEHGLLVMHVQPDGPAKKAGVSLGDMIVKVDDETVEDIRHFHRYLSRKHTGETVSLRLIRSGSVVDTRVELGDRPRR